MKVLCVGDVVGKPGRQALRECLPIIRKQYEIDACIVNCENAAAGFGITRKIADEIFNMGVEVLSSGNHIWDKKEIFEYLSSDMPILRPHNYPAGAPGEGICVIDLPAGMPLAVLNLEGRAFMKSLECPFRTAEACIEALRKQTPNIIVDFHAETTAEKQALGRFLDGKVSAVVGTHTHCQTADDRILPGNTAYLTDLGLTGSHNGVIGMDTEITLQRFLTQLPVHFEVARGEAYLQGAVIDIDEETGMARSIQRISQAATS